MKRDIITDMDSVFLSIIIPTIGRKDELKALFDSITKAYIECRYETIVVDQNEDGLIDDICSEYKDSLHLAQYKVQFKGTSKAKNYGIAKSNGNVVCFPDDDAEMTDKTVANALSLLRDKNADCVFGKCIDKLSGKDSVMKFQNNEIKLSLDNFEGAFVEATMFARRNIFQEDLYDEKMGVGVIFGSQEGYDLVYRLLKKNKQIYYSPEIIYYHPNKISTRTTDAEVRRAFYYSCGLGYLCRKHGFAKKYNKRLMKLNIGIPIIALIKSKELKYYQAQRMGLMLGYKYLK